MKKLCAELANTMGVMGVDQGIVTLLLECSGWFLGSCQIVAEGFLMVVGMLLQTLCSNETSMQPSLEFCV